MIMNPNVLPDLGSVQYCLIDKTGTLTNHKFEILYMEFDRKLYYFGQKERKDSLNERKRRKHKLKSKSQVLPANLVETPPSKIKK